MVFQQIYSTVILVLQDNLVNSLFDLIIQFMEQELPNMIQLSFLMIDIQSS